MKKLVMFALFALISVQTCAYAERSGRIIASSAAEQHREALRKIFQRGAIVNQGIDYFRDFKFELAERTLLESTKKEYLDDEKDQSLALMWLVNLYKEMKRYESALQILKWYDDRKVDSPKLELVRGDLQARIQFSENQKKEGVFKFIDRVKEDYKLEIPPKGSSLTVFSLITELYDLIGDYDAGIQWVKMFKKADKSQPLKRTRKEYDRLIEAFEESKRGMPKVCSDDGKYCVGRATAVIIRSEYF